MKIKISAVLLILTTLFSSCSDKKQIDLSTAYFKIQINNKGFITSMKNSTVTPNLEFSPTDKPSPIMRLYDGKKNTYYDPIKAKFDNNDKTLILNYSNGSIAQIRLETRKKYFKLTLQSLSLRQDIDGIQWGSYHTNITNLLGEIIGVARDTSDVNNYAIGMLSLEDNTLGGTSKTIADAAPFQYIIHSPDSLL